jgi:cytidylate kinase
MMRWPLSVDPRLAWRRRVPIRGFACAASNPVGGRRPVIAIDGPAGAGKSTIARAVAERLGFAYIDTGAMYRAVALAALRRDVDADDGEALAELCRRVRIEFEPLAGASLRVLVEGEDVTEAIRSPDVDRVVPRVANVPGVRAALVEQQRRLARRGGVVVDGRDIGSHVLPDADFKFFVTADPEVRAERRFRQLRSRGVAVTAEEVRRDLRERDALDTGRAVGPLVRAPGAAVVDTTAMSIGEAVEQVLRLVARTPSAGRCGGPA